MTAPLHDQDTPSLGAADIGNEAESTLSTAATEHVVRAQTFLSEGRFDLAREAFQNALGALNDNRGYQHAVALERIGFCYLMESQPRVAANFLQQSIDIVEKLETTEVTAALQGVIQSELGQVFGSLGQLGPAREAFEAAIEIARGNKDQRALAIDLDHLGVLLLREGKFNDATARFEAALSIFKDLSQQGAQAIARHHLGMAAEQEGQWERAEQQFAEAGHLLTDSGDYVNAARLYAKAATAAENHGPSQVAESWYRKALEHSRLGTVPTDLRRHLSSLAIILQSQPGRSAEARELLEEALAAGENSLELDVWKLYGQLADVLMIDAASAGNPLTVQALTSSAQNYLHICNYGPRLLATLKQIGDEPSFGAAVILERLGRCCLQGGRPAPAVILLRQAIAALDTVDATDYTKGLRGVVHSAMGDAYRLAGFPSEARGSYEIALELARDLGDLRSEMVELTHLGAFALADGNIPCAADRLRAGISIARELGEDELCRGMQGQLTAIATSSDLVDEEPSLDDASAAPVNPPFAASVLEDMTTECAFSTDLLIEVRRDTRITPLDVATQEPLDDGIKLTIVPFVRAAPDKNGALRFYIPTGEPNLIQDRDCVIMRKTRREIVIVGDLQIPWSILRLVDGTLSITGILSRLPEDARVHAAQLIHVLAANGALDASARPVSRFIHAATKKGFLAGGGLESESVLQLATDGSYRSYPGSERISLAETVPESIGPFYALTRARRSRRDYTSEQISRDDFDAMLYAACGLTGEASWSDRVVKLRSYPSSGALYAVEIYPVVFKVEGLAPGVYHYVAANNSLELLSSDMSAASFIDACLPIERTMVGSSSAMICLVGHFRRHEHKYGEGGYRMIVAEAGHISQNLVLSATALGLSARPFGGVFDALVNRNLGLDEEDEQFLLSVLVGRVADYQQ